MVGCRTCCAACCVSGQRLQGLQAPTLPGQLRVAFALQGLLVSPCTRATRLLALSVLPVACFSSQIDDVPMGACSYREERAASGGPPMWRRRMDASDARPGDIVWPAGPLQGLLQVQHAELPAGTSLQQLLERLLPPSGLSLGTLWLEGCQLTPAQCSACPLLEPVTDLAVRGIRFPPDSFAAAEAEGRSGNEAQARKAAFGAVLEALLAQMPALESLECGSLPTCVVQRTGLRYLDLGGAYLETLPRGPYLQSELSGLVVGWLH